MSHQAVTLFDLRTKSDWGKNDQASAPLTRLLTPDQIMISPDVELEFVKTFLSFLTTVPSPSELAQVLTLQTLSLFESRATGILAIDSKGQIEMIGHFNLSAETLSAISNFSIWDENVIATCIRNGEAQILDDDDRNDFKLNSFEKQLLVPIKIRETSMGALLVSCSKKSSEKCNSFVEAITKPIAQYLRTWQLENTHALPTSSTTNIHQVAQFALKPRQIVILNRIREGMTTQQIATELGYSRSTIHQEVILIYRLLGVHNKREALQRAYTLGLIETMAPSISAPAK